VVGPVREELAHAIGEVVDGVLERVEFGVARRLVPRVGS